MSVRALIISTRIYRISTALKITINLREKVVVLVMAHPSVLSLTVNTPSVHSLASLEETMIPSLPV